MSNVEAIQTATDNAALTVGLAGKAGIIAPGMLADILVAYDPPQTFQRDILKREVYVRRETSMSSARENETPPD